MFMGMAGFLELKTLNHKCRGQKYMEDQVEKTRRQHGTEWVFSLVLKNVLRNK